MVEISVAGMRSAALLRLLRTPDGRGAQVLPALPGHPTALRRSGQLPCNAFDSRLLTNELQNMLN